jgi:predicted regulator of Ras-like GTPase activity (Roadblock/LC7/MglB family)
MSEKTTMTSSNTGRLDWLLDDLVRRLAGVRHAVVLSTDGLLLGRSTGISRDEAEHFSAMASALNSLARSAGTRFAGGGVRQTVVELDHAVLFVTTAGENACLALMTAETANMGMVAYEMNQTVQRVGTYLSTAPRHGRDPYSPQSPNPQTTLS